MAAQIAALKLEAVTNNCRHFNEHLVKVAERIAATYTIFPKIKSNMLPLLKPMVSANPETGFFADLSWPFFDSHRLLLSKNIRHLDFQIFDTDDILGLRKFAEVAPKELGVEIKKKDAMYREKTKDAKNPTPYADLVQNMLQKLLVYIDRIRDSKIANKMPFPAYDVKLYPTRYPLQTSQNASSSPASFPLASAASASASQSKTKIDNDVKGMDVKGVNGGKAKGTPSVGSASFPSAHASTAAASAATASKVDVKKTDIKAAAAPSSTSVASASAAQDQKKKVNHEEEAKIKNTVDRLMQAVPTTDGLRDQFRKMVNDAKSESVTTREQLKLFVSFLSSMMKQVLPRSAQNIDDDESNPDLTKAQRKAIKVLKESREEDRISKIMSILTLSHTPGGKHQANQAQRKEAKDAKEAKDDKQMVKIDPRQGNQNQNHNKENSEYQIEAHFNYALYSFCEFIVDFRAREFIVNKATKQKVYPFLYLEKELAKLHKHMEMDQATHYFIDEIGKWVIANHDALKRRDSKLFSNEVYKNETMHPYLRKIKMHGLWASVGEDTRIVLWDKAKQIITLATVYVDVQDGGFNELMTIVNDILTEQKLSSVKGHARRNINLDSLLDAVLDRCLTTGIIRRIFSIGTTESESSGSSGSSDGPTAAQAMKLETLLKVVEHVMPSSLAEQGDQGQEQGSEQGSLQGQQAVGQREEQRQNQRQAAPEGTASSRQTDGGEAQAERAAVDQNPQIVTDDEGHIHFLNDAS